MISTAIRVYLLLADFAHERERTKNKPTGADGFGRFVLSEV